MSSIASTGAVGEATEVLLSLLISLLLGVLAATIVPALRPRLPSPLSHRCGPIRPPFATDLRPPSLFAACAV